MEQIYFLQNQNHCFELILTLIFIVYLYFDGYYLAKVILVANITQCQYQFRWGLEWQNADRPTAHHEYQF